jgi:hypothetical protein
VSERLDLPFVLELLENQLKIYVGLNAPSRIFVHAGVVEHNGRAIVLPGLSFSGKTTLVLALVRAGTTYYSDEYAVIDESGWVHSYAKPLSVRGPDQVQVDHRVEHFGGQTGHEPLRIGAAVFAEYRSGAQWSPRQLSPGQGSLEMLKNTLAAQSRADEALPVIHKALEGAVLLAGDRGEADETARQLLESVLV